MTKFFDIVTKKIKNIKELMIVIMEMTKNYATLFMINFKLNNKNFYFERHNKELFKFIKNSKLYKL